VKYASKQLVKLLRLPLKKLLRIALAFPHEFLRGFFDAEGHVDVGVSKGLVLRVGAENSNLSLLLEVMYSLKKLGISSRTERKREKGTIKVIRGKAFVMRRTSYSVIVGNVKDIRRFAKKIGFSIQRKNQKLNDALAIIATYDSLRWPVMWIRLYSKSGGEWVRRRSGSGSLSKSIKHD